jgi:putative transposase
MPEYRRPFVPGGTFFFTVVTQDRRPILCTDLARPLLRSAIEVTRAERPFDLLAIVLLGDHLHAIWELPPGDADFSSRWAAIKARFTRNYLAAGGTEAAVTADRARHRGRGVWQQRFYDHVIRDQDDLNRHLDYLHYNPVKHGVSSCPHAYVHSTFAKWVKRGAYESNWCCCCRGESKPAPDFSWADFTDIE